MPSGETRHPAAGRSGNASAPIRLEEVAEALKNGPRGALAVASIAVALLFIGWIAFYFFLFLPRGPIG
jgi:hypothetical protein